MLNNMTPAVSRALDYARSQSSRFSSRDLLVGLLEEEGLVWEIFEKSGYQPGAVKETLRQQADAEFLRGYDLLQGAGKPFASEGYMDLTSNMLLFDLIEADEELKKILQETVGNFQDLVKSIAPPEMKAIEAEHHLELVDTPDHQAAWRVIDANANRVRESFRVLDDYSRFVLNDPHLTQTAKSLRHDFAKIVEQFPAGLVSSRDTDYDVGTQIQAAGEYRRNSTAEIAMVNCKRLQESLRSLEEYLKIESSALGQDCEQLRYQCYTLEKMLAVRQVSPQKLFDARLYVLLTGSECESSLEWTIKEAAEGGATMFQLREKNLEDRILLERARAVRRWTRETQTLFIVNDRPDIARLVEADGVHLGQDDMPLTEARKLLGIQSIIGVSTHDIVQVRQAIRDGANYIGVGPTFPSTTKAFDAFPGLDFVKAVAAETTLPFFVIGGVDANNTCEVVKAGGKRVAVSSALAKAKDPRLAALKLVRLLGGES
ncbi:thiamine phosphate synthase [Telmatocola sphagniphila]|uniref:Thiamine-phosphate synthase n=1 Tax=Telmatocola sphagniphila TaxID=1123043 RepID=A0A8E6B9I2_9BACT|nr:thiamine phosphate synthase [Telmatocola sphagniphila]QVL33033.1 thiamine phosphate synthase [Telmatocola sphagniphila]